MRRKQKWCLPVETVSSSSRWPRPDESARACFQIDSAHSAILTFEVDLIRIIGVDQRNKPVASTNSHPVTVHRSAAASTRRTAPTSVVLETAIDLVVHRGIDTDMIKLANGNMIQVVPVFHAIIGNVHATVVAKNHVSRVALVDPKCMMIDVNSIATAIAGKCFTAIF